MPAAQHALQLWVYEQWHLIWVHKVKGMSGVPASLEAPGGPAWQAAAAVTHRSAVRLASHAGVGLKHLTGEVKKLMGKILAIDQNHYPEMLGHTCIINAPGFFKLVFAAVKPMLDARTQAKIEVSITFLAACAACRVVHEHSEHDCMCWQ